MDAPPDKPAVPRCVVCAQPAYKLKCVKCKTPYCSVACQTVDWKERGHKEECKRLVEGAAAEGEGDVARDDAPTPPPSPIPKAAPPVVDGPARSVESPHWVGRAHRKVLINYSGRRRARTRT